MNRDPGNDDERKTTSYDEKSVHDRIMRRTESIGGAGSTRERNIPHDRVPGERVRATGFGPAKNPRDIHTPANGTPNVKDAHPSANGTPNIRDAHPSTSGTPNIKDARPSSTSREGTVNSQGRRENTVQGREKGDHPQGRRENTVQGREKGDHPQGRRENTVQGREKGDQPRAKGQDNQTHTEAKPKPAASETAKKPPSEKPRTGGM